ncbi:hypothetical protein L1987_79873 [Smallanthus sonchifolius]|uniref:Uncharacterized protein n=1 Tax=Smallanthus sonchifolius TaxID=185202 RepID=A0ACB8YQB4_9ASTR|nr:hypothetical protein L1987_79873 [Smallanthus sonchifolius]
MGRRQLLYLLYTSSARPPSSTPFFTATPPPPPFLFHKGYSHETSTGKLAADGTISHEKAPSTLEEFKRLEEEKASEGVTSQTAEEGKAGVMEAATGDGSVESVKESFKKAAGDGSTSKTGDLQSTK